LNEYAPKDKRLLTAFDLAAWPDFNLGLAAVNPSTRTIAGPGGTADVEPRIMQVLVVLAEAGGKVVTREALFERCWGGVYVGDASLNRTIGALRKLAANIAAASFEIETIPRTGYRLITRAGAAGDHAPEKNLNRRAVVAIAGGGVAVLALGGGGYWWLGRDRADPRVAALIANGRQILIESWPGAEKQAIERLRKAVALEPGHAEAWGLLAYALASSGSGEDSGAAVAAADRAARTALAIDPRETNALTALNTFQRGMLDWASREDEYRRILAIDPVNVLAIGHLATLLHGVGRSRDSYAMGERANAIAPMSPDLQFRRAMRLWIIGRLADADRVSNRSMDLWPSHRLVRLGRLLIYAFTGRPRAALAIVEDEQASPRLLSSAAASVWRASLAALDRRTPSTIAIARDANIAGSRTTPAIAANAILILSALGELDAAFEVANGFLLGRGSIIVRPTPTSKVPSVNGAGWRNTFGLFTPPTKVMRLDPRFGALVDALGLTEYWRKRRIKPDYQLYG
jgi:DNA-binding winged helix-turn-helix (wHTH) protein/tetratricopeptide (TPR) repeat protein